LQLTLLSSPLSCNAVAKEAPRHIHARWIDQTSAFGDILGRLEAELWIMYASGLPTRDKMRICVNHTDLMK
jgi:hypothetical protein